MSKIRITLASGSVIEKPLVTCFKGTNGNYVVLDNETNGQMGYPIICISKFTGTSLEKIVDQNEWGSVKENLKTIISGTALPYLKVPESLTAQDDFFTQLTLPVTSFDLLKKTYVPIDDQASAPAAPQAPVSPVGVMPTQATQTPEVPAGPQAPDPTSLGMMAPGGMAMPGALGVSPVGPMGPMPMAEMPNAGAVPFQMPQQSPMPMSDPSAMFASSSPQPVQPGANLGLPGADLTASPMPTLGQNIISPAGPMPQNNMAMLGGMVGSNNSNIEALRESFLKSCENMFDALIKNLENK